MLVAIRERNSICRPRHSTCLQILIKSVAYVHPGIPSHPSVKCPLLLPLILPLPIPTSFIFPPFPLPPSHLPHPSPLPPSPSPPHIVPLPIATLFPSLLLLHISPSPLPLRFPLPVSTSPLLSPSFLSTLPTSHFPLPSPLSALASPSASFSPLSLPPQAARITN